MIETATQDISEALRSQAVVQPTPNVELDWQGYFQEFCAAHGNGPIHTGDGRLLFQDGWMYSGTSHEGPEYPPPSDEEELRVLIAKYYRSRKFIVSTERDELRRKIAWLKGLQARKTLPLQEVFRYWNPEVNDGAGSYVTERRAVDLTGLADRLKWLNEDVADCDVKLKGLGDEY